MNRSAKSLLTTTTNLDGFSLADHWWFAKFAKNFPSPKFPAIRYVFEFC